MKNELPESPAVYIAETFRAARRGYWRRWKRCRKALSKKAVHNLRVETRRLLALLDFLEIAHANALPGKTRKILKKRLNAFDDLRDTQVQLQLLKPLWDGFSEAKPLKKLLCKRERALTKNARKRAARAGCRKLSQRLKDLEKGTHSASVLRSRDVISNALRAAFSEVVRLRRNIRGHDPANIHAMRVAFKRFRYTSDLLRPFAPWLTDDELGRMQTFQADAGTIQDLEVLLASLRRMIREEQISAAALKRLRGELERRKRRALDFFMKHVDDLFEFDPDRAKTKPAGKQTFQQ